MLAAVSIMGGTPVRRDVHVRMQGSPGECNGRLGGHTEFIRSVGGLMGGIGLRGGKPHGRMLPQLSRFGMNVAMEGVHLIFLARVISKWLRVAETAHPTTIARLIGRSVFGGMVRINFLRVEISTAHSSKLVCAIRQDNFCYCVMGGSDVTRRIRVPACQMILAVLDHALHADNT